MLDRAHQAAAFVVSMQLLVMWSILATTGVTAGPPVSPWIDPECDCFEADAPFDCCDIVSTLPREPDAASFSASFTDGALVLDVAFYDLIEPADEDCLGFDWCVAGFVEIDVDPDTGIEAFSNSACGSGLVTVDYLVNLSYVYSPPWPPVECGGAPATGRVRLIDTSADEVFVPVTFRLQSFTVCVPLSEIGDPEPPLRVVAATGAPIGAGGPRINDCQPDDTFMLTEPPIAASPPGVPTGAGADEPLRARKLNAEGSVLEVTWDTVCSASDHHLIYGFGSGLTAGYEVEASLCELGTSGVHVWNGVPASSSDPSGLLWFLLLANDGLQTEGSWGRSSDGAERGGVSGRCATAKDTSNSCGVAP